MQFQEGNFPATTLWWWSSVMQCNIIGGPNESSLFIYRIKTRAHIHAYAKLCVWQTDVCSSANNSAEIWLFFLIDITKQQQQEMKRNGHDDGHGALLSSTWLAKQDARLGGENEPAGCWWLLATIWRFVRCFESLDSCCFGFCLCCCLRRRTIDGKWK